MLTIWWTPPSINRILQMIGARDDGYAFVFDVLHIFCESSYGFCNMLMYALNPKVKKIIMEKVKKIFEKDSQQPSVDVEDSLKTGKII